MSQWSGIVWRNPTGEKVFPLDGIVHLAAMNGDLAWSLDPKPDLVTADIDYGYNDVVANNDAFIALSGEDKHR